MPLFEQLSVTAAGSTPNSAGASVSKLSLTLQPADGSNPGVVSTTTQTFAGAKTFTGTITGSNVGINSVAGYWAVGSAVTKLAQLTVTQTADFTATGTTTVNASTTLTGSGTAFLTELGIGDQVAVSSASSTFATVTAIASNTSITVYPALGNGTSQTISVKKAWFRADPSTGPAASSVTISNDGFLLVGYPSAHDVGLTTRLGQSFQLRSAAGGAFFGRYSANNSGASITIAKSRSGTIGTASVITTGDSLGNIAFKGVGSDGAIYSTGAQITINSEGTIGSAIVPANMNFQTANSSGTLTTALTINSSQLATFNGAVAVTGLSSFASTAQFTGAMSPPAGVGIELSYGGIASTGRVLAFDRDGGARVPLVMDGSTTALYTGGAPALTVNASQQVQFNASGNEFTGNNQTVVMGGADGPAGVTLSKISGPTKWIKVLDSAGIAAYIPVYQ